MAVATSSRTLPIDGFVETCKYRRNSYPVVLSTACTPRSRWSPRHANAFSLECVRPFRQLSGRGLAKNNGPKTVRPSSSMVHLGAAPYFFTFHTSHSLWEVRKHGTVARLRKTIARERIVPTDSQSIFMGRLTGSEQGRLDLYPVT